MTPLKSSLWRCPYCACQLQEMVTEWLKQELANRELGIRDDSLRAICSLMKYYCLNCDLFFEEGAVKRLVFNP